MHGLTEEQLLLTFLAIGLFLLVARGTAELARRLGQPEVLGELLGGFLLGPSVLGAMLPGVYRGLFLRPEVSLALSLLSWFGVILLLMIAGMEADLSILKQKALPGLLAAAGAIGASLAIGTYFAARTFDQSLSHAFFLGLVLSVTAVSVMAKVLMEREALRRDYAQVMLAAGIASEIVVWPLISVISSIQHRANPFVAGIRATGLAVAFLAFMLTWGRRFTFWAMRRVADASGIAAGELSLILVLLCISASATTLMGLHPLLGAFAFGVLLSKAPRATVALKERVQALTISFFAPIFFGLAGMRVNLFQLRGMSSAKEVLILFAIPGIVKIASGLVGALAGGLPFWEALTVGVGLNLKGGTDVVVAIVGTDLMLLSQDLYTIYAVVAILTVLVTPPMLAALARRLTPSEQEMLRLSHEEARKLAYLADCERVLVPLVPELCPSLTASLVRIIARAKRAESELFDITEVSPEGKEPWLHIAPAPGMVNAEHALAAAAEGQDVALQRVSIAGDLAEGLRKAAEGQKLLAMATARVTGEIGISFGALHDRVLRESTADVLLAISPEAEMPPIRRILVPVNGLIHAYSAADIAAYIAKGSEAELVLFSMSSPRLGPLFWRERRHRDLLRGGYAITREAQARNGRLGIRQEERVVLAEDPAEAVLAELQRQPYDLLVLGSLMRSDERGLYFGSTVERLVHTVSLPRILLISKQPDLVAS